MSSTKHSDSMTDREERILASIRTDKKVLTVHPSRIEKPAYAVSAAMLINISNRNPKILVVCPEAADKTRWLDKVSLNMNDQEASRLKENMKIVCYQSVRRLENSEWNFIILDKPENAGRNQMRTIGTMNTQRLLILTEKTETDSFKETLELFFGKLKRFI